MGVDLTLKTEDGYNFLLNRHYEFFDRIREIPSELVPYQDPNEEYEGICFPIWYEPPRDGYGGALRYIFVKDLEGLEEFADYSNKEILERISEMPPDTKITLYWH